MVLNENDVNEIYALINGLNVNETKILSAQVELESGLIATVKFDDNLDHFTVTF